MDCANQPARESSRNFETHRFTLVGVKRLALLLAVLAAGCAREQEASLPGYCTSAAALRSPPAPLSDCFAKDSSPGDVQAVGAAFLDAARGLVKERDARALGYLVGAARRGAQESQGIHFEIVRRLEQEARPLSRSRGFDIGARAGRSSG
jgi:hypothetical protein